MINKPNSSQSTSRYTCSEYREEMILAGLQRALCNPDLQPEDKKKLEKEIRDLEKKMGL